MRQAVQTSSAGFPTGAVFAPPAGVTPTAYNGRATAHKIMYLNDVGKSRRSSKESSHVEIHRSALRCYTQQLYTTLVYVEHYVLGLCWWAWFVSRTAQFQERAKVLCNFEIGFPFQNLFAFSQFLICAAQFRNCVNLHIARNTYTNKQPRSFELSIIWMFLPGPSYQ